MASPFSVPEIENWPPMAFDRRSVPRPGFGGPAGQIAVMHRHSGFELFEIVGIHSRQPERRRKEAGRFGREIEAIGIRACHRWAHDETAGYKISQRIRKRIEEAFGWIKSNAGQRDMRAHLHRAQFEEDARVSARSSIIANAAVRSACPSAGVRQTLTTRQ
jgi:hypothetical protein